MPAHDGRCGIPMGGTYVLLWSRRAAVPPRGVGLRFSFVIVSMVIITPMVRVAVIGSGYVGLVAAAWFAELGHEVICVDKDARKIAVLQRGETPIHEKFLPELLARHRGHRLRFSGSVKDATRA